MSPRLAIALGWLGLALAAGLGLAGAPGLSRREAETLDLGRQVAGLVMRAPAAPLAAGRALAALSERAHGPLLAAGLHGFAAEGGARLGLGPLRGARLGAVVVAGLLAALLALAGFARAGVAGALLAPALLLFTPRLLAASLSATPDPLAALLVLASGLAFLRSLEAPSRSGRSTAGLAAGVLAGLAVGARLDVWPLLPLLALHWLLGRFHLWRLAVRAPRPLADVEPAGDAPPPHDWAGQLRRIPTAVGAVLTVAPALAALAFPWLWAAPLQRTLAALREPFAQGAASSPPWWTAAAALPAPTAALLLLGLGHGILRLLGALRRSDGHEVRQGTLWLLLAGLPLLLALAGRAPRLPGIAPLLPALVLLAAPAAAALAALARTAWPARAGALLTSLAALVLYPGLLATLDTFPLGSAAWGEAVGGPPGAATLGLPRQDGGEAARALLPELVLHAAPAARLRWIGVAPAAVARYRAAGLLRADLVDAPDGEPYDLAVVALGDPSRDLTYQAWTALGSARPMAGVYLEEVPLMQVFARAGAWR
jgi:Dolichyl-phosphate-mannose-protein mannosyltransferase